MSAYRFCRTDDMALLVEALNRCWAPHVPGQAPTTLAAFKRSIRDLQVWCSSCMVAFADADPIGVLIGAKRPTGTLVHRIAVRPEYLRQGHGRHLLASLGSKLAILGPPRIVAEVPQGLGAACGLFQASGYVEDAVLTDYVRERGPGRAASAVPGEMHGRYLIPVTLDDLAANGLLDGPAPPLCWERSAETLTARKDEIAGLAIASAERLEACVLYRRHDTEPGAMADIVVLRSFVADDGTRLEWLLSRLLASGMEKLRIAKVHPAELSHQCLETLGFRAAGAHRRFVARAGSVPAAPSGE